MSSSVVEVQPRDLEILRGLFESRIMTLDHIAALYFDGRQEAAKKRVQKLKAGGLIRERPRRPNQPAIHFLTTPAFRLLYERNFLDGYPRLHEKTLEKRVHVSAITVAHELRVMAVKAALAPAIAARPGFQVVEFSTWPLLFQFRARRQPADTAFGGRGEVIIKPDGFIRLHETETDGGRSEHTFFLEVDRSTKDQVRLGRQALYYRDYFQRGGLAIRNGRPASAFAEFPFRVLFVLENAERRNNTAERLLQNTPKILTQVWLTTFDELVAQPLGPIWIRPLDYQAVTHGTLFDPEKRRNLWPYKRQPEREEIVECGIAKYGLLSS